MDRLEQLFNQTRNQSQERLNDTYISIQVVISALHESKENLESKESSTFSKFKFLVPSTRKEKIKEIPRTKERYMAILNEAAKYDMYKYFIIAAVSITEDAIASFLKIILQNNPNKLLLNVQGIESDRNVSLKDILESDNKEDILDNVINKQISGIFYSKPKDLFTYLKDCFKFKIPEDAQKDFIEIKATRDILIHNNGLINSIYIQKAGNLSRGKVDSKIPLDSEYIGNCLRVCKKIIGSISRDSKKYYC